MNNEIIKKIKNIDSLLNNEEKLNEYINNIENSNINTPPTLEESLINTFSKNRKNNVFITNSIKIFKIAACTIFALIMWNISINNNNFQNSIINKNHYEDYEKFDLKFKSITQLLLTPINIERNDK